MIVIKIKAEVPVVTQIDFCDLLPADEECFVVDGSHVLRVEGSSIREATGFEIIKLHDGLNPSEKLYRFATRALALERLFSVLSHLPQMEVGGEHP